MTALRFYLARQSFVLPRHVEQTVAGFGNDLGFRPLPELSRLLAVMRDALKLSVCTGQRNIGWHKAPPTMIAPTEQNVEVWRLSALHCVLGIGALARQSRSDGLFVAPKAIGPKPRQSPGPTGYAGRTCDRGVAQPKVAVKYPQIRAGWSIGVTVRGRLASVDRVRAARTRLPGHGAIVQHIVSPRGH